MNFINYNCLIDVLSKIYAIGSVISLIIGLVYLVSAIIAVSLSSFLISIPFLAISALLLKIDKRKKSKSAIEILDERYAKGNITKEEYILKKNDLKNTPTELHITIDSREKELDLIKKCNIAYRIKNSKKLLSIFGKYFQCDSCNRYMKKHSLIYFYQTCYICRDCWGRFIDQMTSMGGEKWYCSYCKNSFSNYQSYYDHFGKLEYVPNRKL